MRLINWLVHRGMKKEAKRLAEWAHDTYPSVKAKYPVSTETEVLIKMLFDDLSEASERTRNIIYECCQTVQGLCYMIAMNMGALKGFMNFRCLQFTRYMDDELQARGFKTQSKETKEKILFSLDLKVDGWEKITGDIESI